MAHLRTGLGAVLVADGANHRFVFFQPRRQVLGGVAQHRRALFEGVAGLLDHTLENRIGGEGEQLFVEGDVGVDPGFAVLGLKGFAHVHQGQAQLADFLAADRLGHQADDKRLQGVTQLQDVFQAGLRHPGLCLGALSQVGIEHQHTFARH
ncbi:hypothetical protein D3C81_1613410 [compost metagenome]